MPDAYAGEDFSCSAHRFHASNGQRGPKGGTMVSRNVRLWFLISLLLWVVTLFVPWAAFAQEAQQAAPPPPKIDSGDTAWVLPSSAPGPLMPLPRLFLLSGGWG